jgi:hypothetical protein
MTKRAPVQGDGAYWISRSRWNNCTQVPGTIDWEEHVEVWKIYTKKYPGQSAERIAERCGFSYFEARDLLGHELRTWKPR